MIAVHFFGRGQCNAGYLRLCVRRTSIYCPTVLATASATASAHVTRTKTLPPQVLQALQNSAADSLEGCILECPAGLQALVEVLRDPREEVRNEVVVFLGHVSNKRSLLPCTDVLLHLVSLFFLSACTLQVVASLLGSREPQACIVALGVRLYIYLDSLLGALVRVCKIESILRGGAWFC